MKLLCRNTKKCSSLCRNTKKGFISCRTTIKGYISCRNTKKGLYFMQRYKKGVLFFFAGIQKPFLTAEHYQVTFAQFCHKFNSFYPQKHVHNIFRIKHLAVSCSNIKYPLHSCAMNNYSFLFCAHLWNIFSCTYKYL